MDSLTMSEIPISVLLNFIFVSAQVLALYMLFGRNKLHFFQYSAFIHTSVVCNNTKPESVQSWGEKKSIPALHEDFLHELRFFF